MAGKNFIFSMKPYDVELFYRQAAWMMEKWTELASRKAIPGLWKLTDKLNGATQVSKAEAESRRMCKKMWGGLFLVMGIFLFVPGVMKPQELMGPLIFGFLAIVLGVLYLRKDDRKKNSYEKKAKKLLENLNVSTKGQKLRLVFGEKELALSGAGEDKVISYDSMECALETTDLFGIVYENQIVILQKKELLLGEGEELAKLLEEKAVFCRQGYQ